MKDCRKLLGKQDCPCYGKHLGYSRGGEMILWEHKASEPHNRKHYFLRIILPGEMPPTGHDFETVLQTQV